MFSAVRANGLRAIRTSGTFSPQILFISCCLVRANGIYPVLAWRRDYSAVGRSARSLLHGVEGLSTSRSHVRYPMSPMGTTCLRGRIVFPAFLLWRLVGK